MMPTKRLFLAVSLLVFLIHATAQPMCRVRTFNVGNGLPGSVITGLTQAGDGLVWLTSWNGLSCFDGYRFTSFRNLPGTSPLLPTNHLTNVSPSRSGGLWAETYNDEMVFFSTTTCQYINVSKLVAQGKSSHFALRKIYPLANGHTWLVGKGIEHYLTTDSLLPERTAIHQFRIPGILQKAVLDSLGNEWLLSDKGTWLLSPQSKRPLMVSAKPFLHLCALPQSTWLCTADGQLALWKKNAKKPEFIANRFPVALSVQDMTTVDDRFLILNTLQGLMAYDTRRKIWQLLSLQTALAIFADHNSHLWTFIEGNVMLFSDFDRQDGPRHKVLSADPFLKMPKTAISSQQFVFSDKPLFHVDNQNGVWLASSTVPFSHYDEHLGRLTPQPIGGIGGVPRIKNGHADQQGNLWVVCPHSLSLISFHYPRTLSINLGTGRDTRSVMQDHEGHLLLGTVDGEVVKCTKKGDIIGYLSPQGHWQSTKTTFAFHIYSLYEDRRRRLWIGTKERGLYCLEREGMVSHYLPQADAPFGIGSDQVYDLCEDTQGRLLIATFGSGLNIMEERPDGKRLFHHSGNDLKGYDGKAYNKVRRVEALADGTVLLSTTSGLLTYSDRYRHPSVARFYLTHHTTSPGSLLSDDVLQTCQTYDGTVYVVTLGGGLQRIAGHQLLHDNLAADEVRDREGRTLGFLHGYGTLQGLATDADGRLWVVGESRVACFSDGVLREYGLATTDRGSFTEARPSSSGTFMLVATEGGAVAFCPTKLADDGYKPSIVFTSLRHMDSEEQLPLLNTREMAVDAEHRSFTIYFAALDYENLTSHPSGDAYDGIRYAYRLDGDTAWTQLQAGSNSVSFNHFPHGHHVLHVRSTNRDGLWLDNECQLAIYAQPTFVESWWGRTLLCLLALAALMFCVRYYMRRRAKEITEEVTEQADAGKVRYVLRKPEIVDEDKAFMNKLLAYIEEHIADADLKVDDMAAALCVSRSTLYAQVKQIADMSPNSFLHHVRLTRAEELIAGSSQSFSQIAYATGFSDPKYFSKCFKKRTGLSPSAFRARQQKQEE